MEFCGKDEERNAIGVYAIENINTGQRYIGQTTESFERRFWHHRWTLNHQQNSNVALQNAWNEYGEDAFIFRVLKCLEKRDNYDEEERACIAEARAGAGAYNISAGGAGKSSPMSEHAKAIVGAKNREHMTGRKLSEETRAKMRASNRHLSPSAETRAAVSRYMSNRVVSEETRAKVSAAYSGEGSRTAKINNQQAAQIRTMYMNGETVTSIAKKIPASFGIVSNVVNNHTFKNVVVDGWEEFCSKRKAK